MPVSTPASETSVIGMPGLIEDQRTISVLRRMTRVKSNAQLFCPGSYEMLLNGIAISATQPSGARRARPSRIGFALPEIGNDSRLCPGGIRKFAVYFGGFTGADARNMRSRPRADRPGLDRQPRREGVAAVSQKQARQRSGF